MWMEYKAVSCHAAVGRWCREHFLLPAALTARRGSCGQNHHSSAACKLALKRRGQIRPTTPQPAHEQISSASQMELDAADDFMGTRG